MKLLSSRTPQLLEKFETLHQAFIAFNAEAYESQHELHLSERVSSSQFESLSRTLAFCDQLHLVLTLVREDLRSLEPQPGALESAVWTDQLDECIEEWLRTACETNPTVH